MQASAVLAPAAVSRSGCPSQAGAEQHSNLARPQHYVFEHQGATRIVHQPDGTIVCEPLPSAAPSPAVRPGSPTASRTSSTQLHTPAARVQNLLDNMREDAVHVARVVGSSILMLGASVGCLIAFNDVSMALVDNQPINTWQVMKHVRKGAQCVVLGTITGAAITPVSLVAASLRLAIRPALLGYLAHACARWARRNHLGAAAILKKLQSGDVARQLEALRGIVSRIGVKAAFCAEFKKLAGVEVLIKLLNDWLVAAEATGRPMPSPEASLATRALAELAKQGDAVSTLVDLDGIPVLLRAASHGLKSSPTRMTATGVWSPEDTAQTAAHNPVLLVYAFTALARITANNAVAQQVLASEPTAPSLVVSALEAANARSLRGATPVACDELRGHAVALAQTLALEPHGKTQLGAAGGVEALSAALVMSLPWSQGQAAAAAALHALVRGEPDNQRRLAGVAPAGLAAAIHRALVTGSPAGAVTPNAASANTHVTASLGTSGATGMSGVLAKPVPAQDCHAHRADLLALSNIIARYTTPVPDPVTAPEPATRAAPPSKPAFLQRLRMRATARAASTTPAPAPPPVKPTPACVPVLPDPEAGGVSTSALGLAALAVEQLAAAAAPAADAAAAGMEVEEHDSGVMVQASFDVGVHGSGSEEAVECASADLDWEQDLGSPQKA